LKTVDAPARPASSRRGFRHRKGVANLAVMTFAAGLFATVALPAYAMNAGPGDTQAEAGQVSATGHQKLAVSSDVAKASVVHDKVSATSVADLEAQRAAKEAAQAARRQATTQLASYAKAYSGPSAADYLKNPPYPNFSLSQVFQVAKKYIGTPYVFGGASPAGFDCSGLVMFVYAQFGISMPHSATAEAAMGTRISIKDAVPGDLIAMPGHIGFYAGNGNILDAPDSGRTVSIRPIWTSNYYVVRIGIKK